MLKDLKTSGSKERVNAARRQYKAVYRHLNHHSRRSSSDSNVSIIDALFKYYYYGSTKYFVIDYEF